MYASHLQWHRSLRIGSKGIRTSDLNLYQSSCVYESLKRTHYPQAAIFCNQWKIAVLFMTPDHPMNVLRNRPGRQ
ncbi:hypothetical protein XF_0351 [Xylella fastidiosa 9a5c]|uniref:Uncharacterized protein n=1 Tax=Xylella fastidiosa (strain 9a5c) TaxID=160492 RepID=Q9PGF1_XYLFA|nr:hypothetical protein XF_0351 [Xylella fastidiosa 9a5c]